MRFIDEEDRLPELLQQLEAEACVAIDTEAAGYHRYADAICLLQVSTRQETYVVDTLAVDLGGMRDFFDRPDREIVLHDADYDLRLLARDHGIFAGRLFDTKIAAQFLGEPSIGLASLVEKYVGVTLDKKHQRADWAKRPLSPELLAYAADDTRHLLELRDRLQAALDASDRLAWAQEEFTLHVRATEPEDRGPDAYLRLKNIRDLGPRQLAALRELYAWRDARARSRDVAPFRVLSNQTLVAIARRLPAGPAEMREIHGVDGSAKRYGVELAAAVRHALELPAEQLPVRERGPRRPPLDPEFEALVERLRAARDRAAEELRLDRGFLMPRQQLEAVARARPASIAALRSSDGMREWQVEALGDRLLATLG